MHETTGNTETSRYDNSEALRLLAEESEAFAPDHQGADKAGQYLLRALVEVGGKTAVTIASSGERTIRLVAHNVGVDIIHGGYGEFSIQIGVGEKKPVTGLRFDRLRGILTGEKEQDDKLSRPGDPPRYRSASAVLVEAALEMIAAIVKPPSYKSAGHAGGRRI